MRHLSRLALIACVSTSLTSLIAHPSEPAHAEKCPSCGAGFWNYSRYAPFHYHALYITYPRQSLIELEDGSRWQTSERDAQTLLSWQYGDSLQLSLNGYGDGDYTFYISNLSTRSGIPVNLVEGPLMGGLQTHTIQAIDRAAGKLYLSNGTYWTVADTDRMALSQWEVNDPILFGIYNGWYSSYSTLLINVNLNTHLYTREIR